MAGLHELAGLLGELEKQMATCMRCGMCQAVCPLYAETGREADVARGKIVLLEHLSKELLKDPESVKQRLDNCLLCGSCAAACPGGVRVIDIFLKARAVINGYLGLPPAKKIIFRQLLARPAMFNQVIFIASKFQGLFTRQTSEILGASCARFESLLLRDRHFTPLAKTPFHRRMQPLDDKRNDARLNGADHPEKSFIKVAFFYGCLVDKVFPDVAQSAYNILRYHNVGIFMPKGQACCGIPALSSGDRKAFMQLVRENLELFSGRDFDFLVTPCATCTAVIKKIWTAMRQYFTQTEQEQISAIGYKTMDITQFIAEKLSLQAITGSACAHPVPITYHDPCHLKKSLNVHIQPRDLIRANSDYELIEMDEADRCCGMGGSFGLEHYDLSKKVGARKLDNIVQSGAKVAATACPACMLQLIDVLSHSNLEIKVKHVVQIYEQSLSAPQKEKGP